MDNTPPRNRLIALYTALAVVTLVMLKPAFDAYFDRMQRHMVGMHQTQNNDLEQLDHTREAWRGVIGDPWAIGDDRAPVFRAMARLEEDGRLAIPEIRPNPGAEMNLDPLRGWVQLPQEVNLPAPAEPEEPVLEEAVPGEPAGPPPNEAAPQEAAPEEPAPQARPQRPARPQPAEGEARPAPRPRPQPEAEARPEGESP